MNIAGHNTSERVFVVAEIGNNHEGDFDTALRLVEEAHGAGCDAVKFQTFRPEHYVQASDTKRLEMLRRFQLSLDQFSKLADAARAKGLRFLSTPFDLDSATGLASFVDAYKVASGDITFVELLRAVASSGKPVILSSGASSMEEVCFAKSLVETVALNTQGNCEVAVLHCVSSYPTPPEQANLGAIRSLKSALTCPVGYSDHTVGYEAAVGAVYLGAEIVEKHFTLDNNFSDFRDHQLSADPRAMAELVKKVRLAETMLGQGSKSVQSCESEIKSQIRRSVAASRAIQEGEVISWEHLCWVRPESGLKPGAESMVLGKAAVRDLDCGELLSADDVRAVVR